MTPAARIQAAINLLEHIWRDNKPADGVVALYFRSNRYAGSKDRSEITARVYRILRCYGRLCWWLEHQEMGTDARRLVLADLALNEQRNPHDIFDLFSGEKFAAKPLSAAEKESVSRMAGCELEIKAMPANVRLETPENYEMQLRAAFGADFEKEMEALLDMPAVDLRVNILNTSREDALRMLRQENIKAEPTPFSPWGLRMAGRPSLVTHPLYRSGKIEIQDEGSQLIALLTNAKPGQQVVDFCAGAGGKTLAIGAMMQNKGRVIATDVLSRRLMQATKRFRRADLHNIQTHALEEEGDKWLKRHKDHFDAVLVDAPCTGTGTWRRHPDMRWRQLGPPLEELETLQADILARAARLVKPGGRLVYATCSLLPAENFSQVEKFLTAHENFEIVPLAQAWEETGQQGPPPCAGDFMRLTPGQHGTDGFFAAVLRRKT